MPPQPIQTAEDRAAAGDIFAFGGNKVDIQTGGKETYVPPTGIPTGPSVLTTSPAKDAVVDATQQLVDITAPKMAQAPSAGMPQAPDLTKIPIGGTVTLPTGTYQKNPDGSFSFIPPKPTTPPSSTQPPSTPPTPKTPPSQNLIPGTNIPSSGDPTIDQQILQHQTNVNNYQAQVNDIRNKLNQVQNGTYVNAETQALINSISASFDTQISAQQKVNDALLAGYTQTGIRSGRNIYAPEIEMGNLKGVMDKGIEAINKIQRAKEEAIAQARMAAKQSDFNNLFKMMDDYRSQVKEETKAALDLYKQVKDNEKAAQDKATQQLQNIKTSQDIQTGTIKSLTTLVHGLLTGNEKQDVQTIQGLAAQYGVDANKLLSAVEEYDATQPKYTGPAGEYHSYVKMTEAQGGKPLGFFEYMSRVNAAKAAGTAQAGAGAGGFPVNLTGQKDESVISSLPTGEQSIVKGLTDYKIPLPSGFALRSPYWQRILEAASSYDPSFDASQYAVRQKLKTDFTSGKSAQNVRSLNTAIGHLGTLQEKSGKLENAPIQLWNSIKNIGMTATGDSRVTNFNTAANAVESELASLFKGMGASDQEIKAWRTSLNSSESPDQLKGSIDTAVELMNSRLGALKDQWERGMGRPDTFGNTFLSPSSIRTLQKLGVDMSEGGGIESSQEGQTQTYQGTTYKLIKGQWVKQ